MRVDLKRLNVTEFHARSVTSTQIQRNIRTRHKKAVKYGGISKNIPTKKRTKVLQITRIPIKKRHSREAQKIVVMLKSTYILCNITRVAAKCVQIQRDFAECAQQNTILSIASSEA